MTGNNQHLTFVIGEEKRLADIIAKAEIEPLLRGALKAGVRRAALLDENDLPMARAGEDAPAGATEEVSFPLLVEAEPRGRLVVAGAPADPVVAALGLMLRDALQLAVNNNLKRLLTTELHTSVVQESYEQLVASNRLLAESEARYRELALSLERTVEQRTAQLKEAYARMLQQEKLASIGQLAAGMAHEINNPNGFILSNLTTFQKYAKRFGEMLELYRLLASKETTVANLRLQTEARWRELKLDALLADVGDLLAQSLEGAERIRTIVANLKGFSHIDDGASADTDPNGELERTLAVVAPQLPDDTVVIREFTPLPPLRCNPALLCQAFLAIIQNGIHSRRHGLVLRLSTACEGGLIVIRIRDNGCGIPPEEVGRVFDPFFTTREVGEGSGMGLTVAREIVTSHGGDIGIESRVTEGTTVTLQFPVRSDRREAPHAPLC